MDFSQDIAGIFDALGDAVTYTPSVGPAVECRAIRQGGGTPIRVGPVMVSPQRGCFHVLRADIASPVSGAALLWNAQTFTVEAVQPVEGDHDELKWALEVEWGAPIVYRSVLGAGAAQSPPQGGSFTVAVAALAGANLVSIKSAFTVGKLAAGDSFTIAGDATVYTVTGSGVQATSNQFSNVPITPALAANAGLGAAVTFDFARDYPARAAVAAYAANEFAGGVQAGDRRLVIMQAALDAVGATDQPKAGDFVTLSGVPLRVISAVAIYQADQPFAWDLQTRV